MVKSYEELSFTDDYLFCKILSTDLELCKDILELILGIHIREVRLSEAQKIVEITADARGVRFDVYVEDDDNTIFDIEMQTSKEAEFPERSRYYQGMIDLNLIERSASYKQLRRSYIIFIFLKDPFNKNLPIYTFENTCNENPDIKLNDGTTKVAVNAACTRTDLPTDVRHFFSFLMTRKSQDALTRRIASNINKAIHHKKWRVEYMTLQMKYDEFREEGLEEGLEEGRKLGLEQGRELGQTKLLTALHALLAGRDDASLLSEDIDNDTITKAREFLQSAMPDIMQMKRTSGR